MTPTLIETKLKKAGFKKFFAYWVCTGDINVIIDTGPAKSVDNLLQSFTVLNLKKIDYILQRWVGWNGYQHMGMVWLKMTF